MGHNGQPHHVFSFLRCSVLWLMVCSRRSGKAVRWRAVPGKTRPRVASTLGLHRAGCGKREFRRPRRCTIEGAVGKTTGNGGTKVGNVRAVRSRLRRGAGAAKRPAGRRGVGCKSAIGASKLLPSGRRMTPSPTRTARFLVRGKSSPRRRTANLLLPGPQDPPT